MDSGYVYKIFTLLHTSRLLFGSSTSSRYLLEKYPKVYVARWETIPFKLPSFIGVHCRIELMFIYGSFLFALCTVYVRPCLLFSEFAK